jgi:hypothetical protein
MEYGLADDQPLFFSRKRTDNGALWPIGESRATAGTARACLVVAHLTGGAAEVGSSCHRAEGLRESWPGRQLGKTYPPSGDGKARRLENVSWSPTEASRFDVYIPYLFGNIFQPTGTLQNGIVW